MGTMAVILAVLSLEAQGGWKTACIVAALIMGVIWWLFGGGGGQL